MSISPTSTSTSRPTPATIDAQAAVDAFTERVFAAVLGAQEVQAIYLGDQLGWYATLADGAPWTSTRLAAATATAERYAREWLEHQAVAGYLTVDDPTAAPGDRQYRLPAAHAEVLANPDGMAYLAPLARFTAGAGRQLGAIAAAYRTGGGVSWDQLGQDARESQAAMNRPMFLNSLCQDLLPAVPELDAVLRAGARVADIGCGAGWSSIAIARGYPRTTVDGFDPDTAAVRTAEHNAAAYGVADRVSFTDIDAATAATPSPADPAEAGPYDLVFAFECVHDMSDPVSVLRAARRLLTPAGSMIVMDERTAETFTAPGDELERLLYGYSLVACLPDGMSQPGSVGTGTVMRPATLAGYASAAGFTTTEVLAVEHDFFRFYRLVP